LLFLLALLQRELPVELLLLLPTLLLLLQETLFCLLAQYELWRKMDLVLFNSSRVLPTSVCFSSAVMPKAIKALTKALEQAALHSFTCLTFFCSSTTALGNSTLSLAL